ncbi:putative amidoligase domain-containing protein [Syntrophomonas palmitatica]|uniref:putative amidoligase domain-containing protein n=1 Tax=Syntrophomonas palmitatica TaxID=402877 RepID=UPI0006D10483|nr:hypothetical protein [Syntrophomonas palmitatica]
MVLTENIKLALDRAYRLAPYRNLKWLAGSQPFAGYSIGGHIHFSNIKLDAALMRALDNYVAVPVFLLEDPRTAVRRRKRYGLLSEYRIKSYGGFEYRTPGSWLVSREITAAVLCLAKIVVTNYPYLDKNFINDAIAQQAFYQGNHEYFKPLFPEIWSDVQKTSMYDEYSEVLNAIPRMIASGEYWDEKHDIRKVWKISSGGKKDYVANFRPDNDESQDANYDNPGFEHVSAEPLNNRSDAQIRRRPAANNNMGDYDYIPRTSVNRSVHVNAGSNNNGGSSLSIGNVSVSSPARRTRINM